MTSRHFKSFRVFTIDTHRLYPETYDIIRTTEERYGIEIEKFMPDENILKSMIDRFGEYLFFIDKAKQEYCCFVRKIEPNRRALATLDVWITGLRNDQSEHRRKLKKASIIEEEGRKVLKLNPLVDWTIESVWKYIKKEKLPYNVLFDWSFDSVGCIVCSTPLLKGEPPRAGRWRWFNILKEEYKKECGIHGSKK
jgi:phosphoadenosine phosphosulfate reductase